MVSTGSDDPLPNSSGSAFNNDDATWNGVWTERTPPAISGNSSPNRNRDLYFGSQETPFGQTVRNGGGFSRPSSFMEDEKDTFGVRGSVNGFDMDGQIREKRPSGSEYPRLRAVGEGPSRDPSMPPPSRGADASPTYHEQYGPFSGSHTPSNSVALPRPGLGQSLSFPVGPNHTHSGSYDYGRQQQQQHADNVDGVKSLSLDDRPGSHTSGLPFNPGTQPFLPTTGPQGWPSDGLGPRPSYDLRGVGGLDGTYPVPLDAPYLTGKRPNGPQFVASPKRISPPPDTAWNIGLRPPSRDPRLQTDGDRRVPNQMFPQGAPYYQQFFSPNYPPSGYAPLDPYGHTSFRPPMPYNFPMQAYIPGAGPVPMRPSREVDSGRGVRSALLEEFRANSKSTKRYELKVGPRKRISRQY